MLSVRYHFYFLKELKLIFAQQQPNFLYHFYFLIQHRIKFTQQNINKS